MSFYEIAERLTQVHKCAACRTILDQKHFYAALCPRCEEMYRRAKTESCPQCFRSALECTCQPKMLSSAGSLCLRKLFFYYTDKENETQNRLLYFLKHQPNKRAERFVASELFPLVREELSALGVGDEQNEAVIVNVPRGRKAVIENGFDQSERICKAFEEISHIPFVPALKRRIGGKEQKKLSAAERKKNMRSLIRGNEKYAEKIKGKYVILFDDVVTTGASIAACLPILRKMGAKGIICCSMASNMKKKMHR